MDACMNVEEQYFRKHATHVHSHKQIYIKQFPRASEHKATRLEGIPCPLLQLQQQ